MKLLLFSCAHSAYCCCHSLLLWLAFSFSRCFLHTNDYDAWSAKACASCFIFFLLCSYFAQLRYVCRCLAAYIFNLLHCRSQAIIENSYQYHSVQYQAAWLIMDGGLRGHFLDLRRTRLTKALRVNMGSQAFEIAGLWNVYRLLWASQLQPKKTIKETADF